MQNVSGNQSQFAEKLTNVLILKKLTFLSELYSLLFDATVLINHLFAWSLLLNIAKDFIDTLSCGYWIVLWFIEPSLPTLFITLGCIVVVSLNLFHIVSISKECYYAVLEVLLPTTKK